MYESMVTANSDSDYWKDHLVFRTLRKLLKEVSQKKLAERTGLSRDSIRNFIMNPKSLKIWTFLRLIDGLGLDIKLISKARGLKKEEIMKALFKSIH